MGLFEQLTNPIPTYCLEKFTEEDLIRCIYELFNYKKMNESVTVPEAYTLNDNDVAEVLQNMNSDVQAQEVEEEITEETTEEDFNEEVPEDPVEQVVEQSDENIEKIKKILADNNDDEEHSRFKGASWYDVIQQKVIMLAGIGGIGSWSALLIARLNPKAIWLYDDDRVEVANMSGQLFGMDDCGKFKTSAIVDTIKRYTTFNDIFEKSERINSSSEATDIMICGFDNMEARKTYFTLWVKYIRSLPQDKRSNCLFIDGKIKCLIACL